MISRILQERRLCNATFFKYMCNYVLANGMQDFPDHYQIFERIRNTRRWEQEPCPFTCWCSPLWEGHSSPRSHKVCSHSLQSPSIPPYTCHSVALPPQACKGSHHCWDHRRSLSRREGWLIQLDGRNTLQQRGHTRTDEQQLIICRLGPAIPKWLPFTTQHLSETPPLVSWYMLREWELIKLQLSKIKIRKACLPQKELHNLF